jgi:hypothetical protein
MQMQVTSTNDRLQSSAVLVVVKHAVDLSAFELAALALLDGQRTNEAVARALGVDLADLRIALGALLEKGVVDVVAAPRGPAKTPRGTPLSDVKAAFEDRRGAIALHARSVRALRKGEHTLAFELAHEARELAPSVAQHQEHLAQWDDVVERTLGVDLEVAARLELVRAYAASHEKSAGAWSLLATLLAGSDPIAAAEAARRAAKLSPESADRARAVRELDAAAVREGRRNKLRSLFTPAPPKGAKRR